MSRHAKNAMRSTALRFLLLAGPVLTASGGCAKTLPPDDPSNAESDQTEDAEAPPPEHSTLSASDPMVPVTVKDEGEKKAMSCGGAAIADLSAVLAQSTCEVKDAKPDEPQKDLKDLEVTVAADSPKVAPGSSAKITVTFHNKGKTVLPLDFMVDPEPRFDFEVYTPKGARADNPKGDSPALPPEVQNAPEPEKTVARITLAPNGTAKVSASWTAVKFKWASKDKAKGAVPGRGYPREPGGPLPKGKYVLRVITPLVGVAEGGDHEISQPRTPIEVGNL
ncbi:MAG TPA: hypothetical protein VH044_03560 [Polyangiaceae bacterium]|jgi:hypothetical protein|nr:hypothetical protein [Polyangiaceae bacterium]